MSQFSLAPEVSEFDINLPVGSDLSTKQYLAVKLSSGLLVLSGADEGSVGILQNKPNGSATVPVAGVVRTGGLSKWICGTAWSSEAPLSSDAAGKGAPQTVDKKKVLAYAIGDAVAADVALVRIAPSHSSL